MSLAVYAVKHELDELDDEPNEENDENDSLSRRGSAFPVRLTGVGVLERDLYARVPLDPEEDYTEDGVKVRRVYLYPKRPRWGYAAHDICCMILCGRLGHMKEDIIFTGAVQYPSVSASQRPHLQRQR